LYRVDPEQYGYEENKFLPLLYAALSVGYLFSSIERAHLVMHMLYLKVCYSFRSRCHFLGFMLIANHF
jgi:hypothetical protein